MTKSDPKSKPNWKQLPVATFLLLVLVAAVLLACWRTEAELQLVRTQLPGLRSAARRLSVNDPTQYAVVKDLPQWWNSFAWKVHVPEQSRSRLMIATDGIEENGRPVAQHEFELSDGKHALELNIDEDREETTVELRVDSELLFQETFGAEWNPRIGSEGGSLISNSQQSPLEEGIDLYRRRWVQNRAGKPANKLNGPHPGVQLWIAPTR